MNKTVKSNLSRAEWKAINDLKNDQSILIKKADKGGAVVICSRDHYKTMVMSQLNDETTYKKLNSNPDPSIMKNIKSLVGKYNNLFTEPEKKFLNYNYYETSKFYGNPKIHKSELIKNATKDQNKEVISVFEPEDLKLRPIVGGPKCPTRRLSKFLDTLLKPLIKHVQSNIKDNIDFLNKCERKVSKDTILTSFDVCSLYTSIPHEYGLTAIEYFITKFRGNNLF